MDIMEHSSQLFHGFSMNENLNKKDPHRKLKRLNASIWNLIPKRQPTKNFQRKNTTEQVQEKDSFLHPPSQTTTSELSRSISNKSITFASVFDDSEKQNNNHPTISDLDQDEDLIIVVPNKYVYNEPPVNNSNPEPYPFRSELPSCSLSQSHSSSNMINSSHSKTKSRHYLIHLHRPKKLRHPFDRSNSAPNFLSSSTPTSTSNEHHRPIKTIRQWFKSSSFGRFIQTLLQHPKNSNTKHLKSKSRVKPTLSRNFSDLIY